MGSGETGCEQLMEDVMRVESLILQEARMLTTE